ncbi:MAG: CNNM domain-containing protein [Planctomycetota bacterium]
MNELQAAWPYLVTMLVLMAASGLFSGSEAALFSLRDRDRKRLARSRGAGRIAGRLLADPEQLLSAILFWNLLINMIYFAIVAIVSKDLSRPGLFTLAGLVSIIFFCEMLPKSLAVMTPLRISLLVALPMAAAVTLVRPVLPIVRWANHAASRLIWPTFQPEPEIELSDIERAIDLSTDDALLLRRERLVLQSLIGMADTRVDELMRPRSRLMMAPKPLDDFQLSQQTPPGGYLLVVEDTESGENENIVGSVALRLLRPSQWEDLGDAIERVVHVPWSARVAQVFDQLDAEDVNVAVVVNEFGEVLGALSVDDILRGVLASRDQADKAEDQIQTIGSDHFRMPGSTSLRALSRVLNVNLPDERAATVAGHFQRHNERVPRVGDVAPLSPFELVVTDQSDDQIWIEAWRVQDRDGDTA